MAEIALHENKNLKLSELTQKKKFFGSSIRVGMSKLLSDVNEIKTDVHKSRIIYILSNAPAIDLADELILGNGPKDLYQKYLRKALAEIMNKL